MDGEEAAGSESEHGDDDQVAYSSELWRSEASRKQKKAVGRGAEADRGPGDEHLAKHRLEREKDVATCELVVEGIKQNRFCKALDAQHLRVLVETMEYFAFEAGETIVTQGEAGHYFFVAHSGPLEVSVDGKVANTLERGGAFGAIALIYNCPRTATVVAKASSGVWGIDGMVFRKVLKEHAEQHYAENRQFLDRVSIFDGLSARQKARVGELAIFNEWFEAGARVVSEGEVPTAMYIVKSGELSVMREGSIDEKGHLEGGVRTALLRAGDVFGEQSLLAITGEKRSTTVVADTRCELVCIGIPQLKEVLGEDLAGCLEHAFMSSILRKLPVISQLSLTQLRGIASVIEVRNYQAGQELGSGLRLAIVIHGDLIGRDRESRSVSLKRGTWAEDSSLADLLETPSSSGYISSDGASGIVALEAGADGARLATLTFQALAEALKGLGLASIGSSQDGTTEYMRKVLLARKVPVFRNLSESQIDKLVVHLVLQEYTAETDIFKQGELGSTFFVVASGELQVQVDDRLVRTLTKGASFGERALLLDEPRSATVTVCTQVAKLWCIDRKSFQEVVTESMREELIRRVQLYDTSITLGNLRHVRLIGAGSFGSVRLVEHQDTGMRYALKRVRKKRGEIPPEVERECYIMAEVDHPFAICMVKTFATASSVYILMELVTGGQLLNRGGNHMEIMNRKQAQFYVGSLALILESLHERSIVYRDLKPENIMLDAQGYIKLVDFGIAKKVSEKQPRTWTLIGTIFYMAPELIAGRGYGVEVDIWALGVVFFELVCGCLPFGDEANDEHGILSAILDHPLNFPARYTDMAGKKLLRELLKKKPKQRIGSGVNGWMDIKSHKFFNIAGDDFFNKIVGREIEAPCVPYGEIYGDDAELQDQGCTLSDAEVLNRSDEDAGNVESGTIAKRLRECLQKVGASDEGFLDRESLGEALKELNSAAFGDKGVVDGLWAAMDKKGVGTVPLGRILAVQDEIAELAVRQNPPSNMRGTQQKALSLLSSTDAVKHFQAKDVKPPPGPRPGPPGPRSTQRAAVSGTAASAAGEASAPVPERREGRAASRLREEVATARSARQENDEDRFLALPSVGTWYARLSPRSR